MRISTAMQAKLDAARNEFESAKAEHWRRTGQQAVIPACKYVRPCYVVKWLQAVTAAIQTQIAAFKGPKLPPSPFYQRAIPVTPVKPDNARRCKTCQGRGKVRSRTSRSGFRECWACLGIGRVTEVARD